MNLFNGSPETTMLLWSAVLGLVQLILAATFATRDQGFAYNISARDGTPPPVGVVTARMQRAFKNFCETFPIFAVAVIVLTLSGHQNALSALGAQLYFWARLAYVPIYASGVIVVRTLVWSVSLAGIVMVMVAALT